MATPVLRHAPGRAVLSMTLGTAFVAGTDIVMKHLAADHSLPAIMWVRNLFIIAFSFVLLKRSGEWTHTRTTFSTLQLVRSLFMSVSPIMYFIALMSLPVAELTALNLTMPIFMALLAVSFLKEPLNGRRITAVLIGFAGVLAIVRPGTDAFSPYMLLGIAAAAGGAVFQILSRKMVGTQSAMASLFYPWVIATLLATPFAFWRWTPPVSLFEWFLVVLIAAMSLTGNTLMVRSYQFAPASLVAPFIYMQLAWATFFSWAIFADFPDGWSLAGMITIVASGLLLVERSRLRDN